MAQLAELQAPGVTAVLPEREPRPNILIVDDRKENLLATEKILRHLNAAVFCANSGNEALSLVLRHRFAVVLLDVQMPEMDGFETAVLMQEHESMHGVPIIIVTAISKEERYATQAAEIGAVDYIFKPINSEILRSKVKVYLDLYVQRRTDSHAPTPTSLQQSNTELERFAYICSHDMQEPARMMNSYASMLDEKYGPMLDEKGRRLPAIHYRQRPPHAEDDPGYPGVLASWAGGTHDGAGRLQPKHEGSSGKVRRCNSREEGAHLLRSPTDDHGKFNPYASSLSKTPHRQCAQIPKKDRRRLRSTFDGRSETAFGSFASRITALASTPTCMRRYLQFFSVSTEKKTIRAQGSVSPPARNSLNYAMAKSGSNRHLVKERNFSSHFHRKQREPYDTTVGNTAGRR